MHNHGVESTIPFHSHTHEFLQSHFHVYLIGLFNLICFYCLPFLLCFLEICINCIALLWICDLPRSCLFNRPYWPLRGFCWDSEAELIGEIDSSWGNVWVYESFVYGRLGIVVQYNFHLAKVVTILNLFPAADYTFLVVYPPFVDSVFWLPRELKGPWL